MPEFEMEEKLFRKIPAVPGFVINDENGKRISSAAFKDSKGCSVDRQFNRDESLVYEQMYRKFKDATTGIQAIASVTYSQCLEVSTKVKEMPEIDNEYHCEIHCSEIKIQLTSSQAKKLANNAIVKYLDSPLKK